ncbi:chemotaxis protein MotC [Mesorhizobium sp. SB112]|uniref:chemotaxis protein MotC n=1 Tax=Mesorhizobium sp. SB112 TaxID=3151853 RepID=UPI003265AA66
MHSGLRLFGIAGAVMAFVAPAGAEEASHLQPYQMVRSLQLVQDRIATGDHAALPMQQKLLEMTDKTIRDADTAVFDEPRNFRALLIYGMSGGNPLTLERTVSHLTLGDADKTISEGIVGYLRGNPRSAQAALEPVDPMILPRELGAFLALVKGAVLTNEDPAKALIMFDQARLLGTGTLVEEASLRRTIMLATSQKDAARFIDSSRQYASRYLRSPYASQFANAFVRGVAELHDAIPLDGIAQVADLMNPEQKKTTYLRIARRAAIEGITELSAFASRKARENPDEDKRSVDSRAILYSGLSSITSGTSDEILEKLSKVDRDSLSQNDKKLLDAAKSVASELTGAPPPLASLARVPAPPAAPESTQPSIAEQVEAQAAAASELSAPAAQKSAQADETDAMLITAREKLDAIDKLLGETIQ